MNYKKITVSRADSAGFSGNMAFPADKQAEHFILLCHGLGFQRRHSADKGLIRSLTGSGVAVLSLELAGPLLVKSNSLSVSFTGICDQIRSAVSWLETNFKGPEVLIGHSAGGLALLTMADDVPGAKAFVTIGCPLPLHTREGESSFSIDDKIITLTGLPSTKSIKNVVAKLDRPVLIMHAIDDEVVEIEQGQKLFSACSHPKNFISLDGADHFLSEVRDAAFAASMITPWMMRYLEPERPSLPETGGPVITQTGLEHYRTLIKARHHHLSADEPVDVGGKDVGPTPYELLIASLGTCTGITLRMYADRKKWPLEGIKVHLTHKKVHEEDCLNCEDKDARLDTIERQIEFIGDLSDEQQKRLMAIADRCPIHQTLTGDITISTSVYSTDS